MSNVTLAPDETSIARALGKLDQIVVSKSCIDYEVLFNWLIGRDFRRLSDEKSDAAELYARSLLTEVKNVEVNKCYVSFLKNSKKLTLLDAI